MFLHIMLVPKLRAVTNEKERALASTDRKIDELVYQLYGLTQKEIALVEKN